MKRLPSIISKKLVALVLVLSLQVCIVLLCGFFTGAHSAGEVELNQYLSISTSGEKSFLDRQTRIITSTANVTIKNTSDTTLLFPFYAVININGTEYSNVSMPDALGGPDTGPYGKYYYKWESVNVSDVASNFGKTSCSSMCTGDFDRDGDVDGSDLAFASKGGKLEPGDSITFKIKFERAAGISFTYNIQCLGTISGGNQVPVADAGVNRTVILPSDQSEVTLALDGSGSTDPDGTITGYIWSGTPDPDDVARPKVTLGEGTFVFTLVVRDNDGAESAPDQVTIIVKKPGGFQGHPPVLSVDSTEYSVDEGQTLSFNVSATDEDGDAVVISAAPKVENATFESTPGNHATGTFTFTPDYDQQGVYLLEFKAMDPIGLSDSRAVRIIVNNVNRPPSLTVPQSAEVDEGSMITIPVKATDPDGELVTLSAAPLPENAIFIPSTGTITFAPDFDQAGSYDITCTATDGKDHVSGVVHVTVNDVPTGTGGPQQLVLNVNPVESPTFQNSVKITGSVNANPNPVAQKITSALITSLAPSAAKQGQTIDVTLTGKADGDFVTHFAQGISQVSFGKGITVNSLRVNSETEAIANVTINPDAETGPRQISITTGNEQAISTVAFNVLQGTTTITGTLVDPDTGQPISGAVITVQGTGVTATTGSDGSFELKDVPAGQHTIIISARNHELVTVPVNPASGSSVDLGNVGTRAVVYDPSTAPAVSTFSVVGRGIGDVLGNKDLEELKQMVTDTMLVVGGTEAGVIDEYGNQLNPQVQGYGLVSLNPEGVRLIAQKLQRGGETVALGDILFAFSFGFKWTGGTPLTLAEWIQMLQEQVNAAWTDPTLPENALAIVMFNRGKTVSIEPPVLSPETRLNPMQAFLFASSLWASVYSQQSEQAHVIHNDLTNFARLKRMFNMCLGGLSDLAVPPALADDSTLFGNNGGKFTRFWRNAFKAKANLLTSTVNSAYRQVLTLYAALCFPIPDLASMQMYQGARWPIVGSAMDNLYDSVRLLNVASMVPEPPPADSIKAKVITSDDGKKRVEISFSISESHKMGNFSSKNGPTYVYTLYRGKGPHSSLEKISQLVVTGDTLVLAENPSKNKLELIPISQVAEAGSRYEWSSIRFRMIDQNPLPIIFDSNFNITQAPYATWFYTITLARVTGLGSALSKQALDATVPWWNTLMAGIPSVGPFAEHSKHIQVSDYSAPVVVSLSSGEEVELSSIEVNPQNGDVFCLENRDKIFRIDENGTGDKILFADTSFVDPGANGLAIDKDGAIYTENSASDEKFGGHIFKFESPTSLSPQRSLVGTVGYFSRWLMFAHPVSAGPIAIGEGVFTSDSPEDLFVVEKLSGDLKAVPVNATRDPFRRVGQRWAHIPFYAEAIDLEFDPLQNPVLLVQRVASANLASSLEVSTSRVALGETFKVTLQISNPSMEPVNNVRPILYFHAGRDKVALITPSPGGNVTLQPGKSVKFEYEYRAIKGGMVEIQGQAEGEDPTRSSISSPSTPPNPVEISIGCPLVFEKFVAEPSRVLAGDVIHLKVRLHNEGSSTYTNITPQLDVTQPVGKTGKAGEVSQVTGPSPATLSLSPGDHLEFEYTCEATKNGYVAFECTVTALNSETGYTDECGPGVSNDVLISPLTISVNADPGSVKFEETESTEVTVTVKNSGSKPINNLVPKLTQLYSGGEFESWEVPDLSPVTLAGGESKTYVYRLSKPKKSGVVRLEAVVSAQSENGEAVECIPAKTTVTIGPSITGHVYDVMLNGKEGLNNYFKDTKKKLKFWIDESHPLVTSRKIEAVPIVNGQPDESHMVESPIDSKDGSYVLALPGPGTYELRMDGVSGSNVGFKVIARGIEDETVTKDFYVPHSLVMTSLDLIDAYRHLTVSIGGFENLVGGAPLVLSYDNLVRSFEDYLQVFRKGQDSPPYEGLWEGEDDEREATHPSVQWDALIRLDAALVFNLRRFSEAGAITVETVQDILPILMANTAINDFFSHFKYDKKEEYQGLKYYYLAGHQVAGKYINLLMKALTSIGAAASNPKNQQDEERVNFYTEAYKWMGEIFQQVFAIQGIAVDVFMSEAAVYDIVSMLTRLYMKEVFIEKYSEPVLLDAVKRAAELDLAGTTEGVMNDLKELDEYIVKQTREDMNMLNTTKTANGAFKDFEDVINALKDWLIKEASQKGQPYAPGKVFQIFEEAGPLLTKLSGALLAIQAVDVMGKLFVNKPGEVCVATDQVFTATPNFMLGIPGQYFGCAPGRRVR